MPLPQKQKHIAKSTIRDEVYEKLLEWITGSVLKPGEKISDQELAAHLGVSRTPVREALRRLEDKGLVETAANRWTRVTEISLAEAHKIYPMIACLEELAIAQAAPNLTQLDLAEMERLNRDMEAAIRAGHSLEASLADAGFHEVFIARAENRYLADVLADLKLQHRRLEVLYFQGGFHALASVREHEKVLAALGSDEVDTAGEIIKSNWLSSLERMKHNNIESSESK